MLVKLTLVFIFASVTWADTAEVGGDGPDYHPPTCWETPFCARN